MNSLDPSKLTSIDQYGNRLNLIPAEVRGFFQRHRSWSQIVMLIIFLALPWTEIRGQQTILLNIPEREFAIFGIFLKAHDVPLLFYILGILVLGLAFVTSIWGRVWCGWTCPQTVFIEAVYRRIERWTEGNYLARRKMLQDPMSFTKFRKVSLKWFLFVLVSSLIAHSFMAYFVGAKNLIAMMGTSPTQNWTYFVMASFFTGLILFDFAWFREQFCVIMCPYGRIQSVLLDQKSLAVVYDQKRGEPRRSLKETSQPAGDCVSCNRCVQVCPTGIDIRNGLQMECIACTACIDACDEIMEKVNKPKGLIKYETLDGSPLSLKKPRSVIYMLGIAALAAGLTYALSTRQNTHFSVLRGAGLPYSYVKDSENKELLLNQFRLHIQNQGQTKAVYEMTLPQAFRDLGIQLQAAENPLTLNPKDFRDWYFFVRTPPELINQQGQLKIKIQIKDLIKSNSFEATSELIILGPRQ